MFRTAIGRVRRRQGVGAVAVAVSIHVSDADSFRMTCAFRRPALVRTPAGELLSEKCIEAACLSGAAYARRFWKLDRLKIEITQAEGLCHLSESEGLAVAAVVAIGEAAGTLENLRPEALGGWEMVESEIPPSLDRGEGRSEGGRD